MTRKGIDIVSDTLKTVTQLNGQVYKLHAPHAQKPFVILNIAFGITHPTMENPANVVGEGIKIDFYLGRDNDMEEIFDACHSALLKTNRVLSLISKFTFEEDSTPTQNTIDAVYRLTAIYRIRVN